MPQEKERLFCNYCGRFIDEITFCSYGFECESCPDLGERTTPFKNSPHPLRDLIKIDY